MFRFDQQREDHKECKHTYHPTNGNVMNHVAFTSFRKRSAIIKVVIHEHKHTPKYMTHIVTSYYAIIRHSYEIFIKSYAQRMKDNVLF